MPPRATHIPVEDHSIRQVLVSLANGNTTAQTAQSLDLTHHQVEYRIRSAVRHFRVPRDPGALVHRAYQEGWLIPLPAPAAPAHAGMDLRLRQVLAGITAGESTRQTADRLHLKGSTVRTYTTRLFRHLGARNRAHAVALGHQYGHLAVEQPRCQEATNR